MKELMEVQAIAAQAAGVARMAHSELSNAERKVTRAVLEDMRRARDLSEIVRLRLTAMVEAARKAE